MRFVALVLVVFAAMGVFAQESFEVRDRGEFEKVIGAGAKVEKLAGGMKFTEGPVWLDGYLVFSDIPNNRLMRWNANGGPGVFREGSNQSNGNTKDRDGNLITCEHQARRVTRTDVKTGQVSVLVDGFEGKRLNSPNDVVVKSDGTIWFTDPTYGGHKDLEVGGRNVYRFEPKAKALSAVVTGCDQPNGLAFSPDEKRLYVADSGKPKHIRVFEVKEDGMVGEGRVFCTIDKGVPDGIRVDADGRVWSSAQDGVHIFTADGKLIGKILLPENCANLCFGGAGGDEVYMTATTSLYRVKTNVRGGVKPAPSPTGEK
jgi:gluconolactonase